ncbi:uncharacterized protein EV422DRAFT_281301 [Fimicolochytrium jonesii]|uniref:uncharacterized protein n=1 Tax=Fimicolochytrium jonesii TaxID=1396493 RepID=UPI0022FF13D9|nr:uncharacterized protein EV422DRAFT_281301 [Fimicolochytrium jonesii]KAI8816625.1 hypothetical protein EV422DRAFT_281301 [Fimicolochytrium jonesii]
MPLEIDPLPHSSTVTQTDTYNTDYDYTDNPTDDAGGGAYDYERGSPRAMRRPGGRGPGGWSAGGAGGGEGWDNSRGGLLSSRGGGGVASEQGVKIASETRSTSRVVSTCERNSERESYSFVDSTSYNDLPTSSPEFALSPPHHHDTSSIPVPDSTQPTDSLAPPPSTTPRRASLIPESAVEANTTELEDYADASGGGDRTPRRVSVAAGWAAALPHPQPQQAQRSENPTVNPTAGVGVTPRRKSMVDTLTSSASSIALINSPNQRVSRSPSPTTSHSASLSDSDSDADSDSDSDSGDDEDYAPGTIAARRASRVFEEGAHQMGDSGVDVGRKGDGMFGREDGVVYAREGEGDPEVLGEMIVGERVRVRVC